ncbi:MAG: prepilin-type N-terminal cleavage/methylation domain-containing protein [Burkholderiales bacterium]|nr:MAG: prepilin-type N-terminal cleavage/methylation domain-containing protein [Burkholderiales bacterium]
MKRQNVRGVTLIELMVVMVLLVMMLMAVVPSISAWIRNTHIRNVATGIQNGLQRARAEAMRRNTNVRFSLVSLTDPAVMDDSCKLSDGGVSWVVSLDDPTGKCSTAVSDSTAPRILDKAAGGGANVVQATSTGGAEVVVFNGFGRAATTDGISSIDIESTKAGDDFRALRIVVGTGGTIRMCEPKVGSSTDPRAC